MILVQSSLPPKPTSMTAISTSFSAKYLKASAVVSSKKDGCSGSKKSRSCSTKSTTYCSSMHLPFIRIRSRKFYKMRRSVKSDFVASRLKYSCQGMRAGTFSVGSCHVYGLELAVRMVEMAIKLLRIEQALLISRSPHLFKDGGRIK